MTYLSVHHPLLIGVSALMGVLPEPVIYRGPGGAPVIGLHPASLRPPAGLLPPGPPPGLPPALRLHRLPTGTYRRVPLPNSPAVVLSTV